MRRKRSYGNEEGEAMKVKRREGGGEGGREEGRKG